MIAKVTSKVNREAFGQPTEDKSWKPRLDRIISKEQLSNKIYLHLLGTCGDPAQTFEKAEKLAREMLTNSTHKYWTKI